MFLKILKKDEHPTFDNNVIIYSEEDIAVFKYFIPKFLDAVAWYPDNVTNSISIHCTIDACVPHQISSVPHQHFLFKNICEYHYNYILSKLEARNTSFEQTKLNCKSKPFKVVIKYCSVKLRQCFKSLEEHSWRFKLHFMTAALLLFLSPML